MLRMFIEISFVAAVLSVASGLTFKTPRNVVASSVSSVSWTATSDDSIFSVKLTLSARHLALGASEAPPTSTTGLIGPATISTTGFETATFIPNTATSSLNATTSSSTITTTTSNSFSSTAPTSSSSTTTTSSGSSTPIAIAPSAKKNPLGAIVGGVVGGIVALVLVGLFTFLSIRRRGRPRQEGFERGTFEHPEDEMRENPTSDRPVPLGQEVVTTEDADISNPHVEQRANSPLHGPLFALFGSASSTLYSENPHSLRIAETLPSLHDMHSDTSDRGSSVTISTARATLGEVRYKVASEADNIPSRKTDGVSAPEQVNPTGVIRRDEEQPLDIVSSDSLGNTTAAPLPLQALNQIEELNNQGHDLNMEEDVLLLELREVQIARRLVEIRSTRNRQTPPPQYASS